MQHWYNLAVKESGLECSCVNNDDFTVLVSGGSRCHWVNMCTVWLLHSKWLQVEQWICSRLCIKFCIKLEHSSMETIQIIQNATAMGNWWLAASSCPVQIFLGNHQITWVTQPACSQDMVPCNFWLFPKLKSPLNGKRYQTVNEIQENITGQLMAIGRTVWGPKVPTLKETEASLSYVQCFLYLVSSSLLQ